MSALKLTVLAAVLIASVSAKWPHSKYDPNEKKCTGFGCPTYLNPDDPVIIKDLKKALAKIESNLQIVKILNAYRLAQAGTKYTVKFVAKETGSEQNQLCEIKYRADYLDEHNSLNSKYGVDRLQCENETN